MKKNIGIILTIMVLLISILFSVNKYKENTPLESVKIKESKIKKEKYAMYKENDNGEYVEYESDTFPLDTHVLNLEKSKCIDNKGNIIEGILRNENNKVIVDSNKTSYCYLYFDVKEYVITYNGNGGTIAEERKVVARGESIGSLPTPTKGKDYFAGWYTDTNYQTKIEEDYVPTRNMTIYARFYEWIDLKIGTRTKGYPSDTTYDKITKRTFDMNTYIVGLAYDNYYESTYVSNYSLSSNSINVTVYVGYGIGLPITLENGRYIIMSDVQLGTNDKYAHISIVKYTSEGSSSYEAASISENSSVQFEFNITSNDSYEAIVFCGGGNNINYIFSNINLYKIN